MATTKGKEETNDPGFITVKSANEGRVGLWEVDPAHEAAGHKGTSAKDGSQLSAPGEIFVGDKPVKAARTSRVMLAVRDGQLVEANAKGEEKE